MSKENHLFHPKQSEDFHSLDIQIKEARRRAEEFSKSLQNARKEEDESLKNAEEERRKWAASYEEKTVMIEQLQRELASTVETLNYERKTEQSYNPILTSSINGTGIKTTQSVNFQQNHKNDIPRNSNYQEKNISNRQKSDYHDYSFELKKCQNEIITLNQTINTYRMQESSFRNEIANLKVELEHTKNAWRDSESKVQFRSSQIKQLETEIDVQQKEKNELKERLQGLEKLYQALEIDNKVLKSCSEELSKANQESMNKINEKYYGLEKKETDLQQTINTLLNERERFEKSLLMKDKEIKQLRELLTRMDDERYDWEKKLKEIHQQEIELIHKTYQIERENFEKIIESINENMNNQNNQTNKNIGVISSVIGTNHNNSNNRTSYTHFNTEDNIKFQNNEKINQQPQQPQQQSEIQSQLQLQHENKVNNNNNSDNSLNITEKVLQQVNQTQDDIDKWLQELKAQHEESDIETQKSELDVDYRTRKELTVNPEVPPVRPPLIPYQDSQQTHQLQQNYQNGTNNQHPNQLELINNPSNSNNYNANNNTTNNTNSNYPILPTPIISIKSQQQQQQLQQQPVSHTILDMQSFNPPRVQLFGQASNNYHNPVQGSVFLSQFHQKVIYPNQTPSTTSNLNSTSEYVNTRRSYFTDLLGEENSVLTDIKLGSPERINQKQIDDRQSTISSKTLQIRVPSGRSPKRKTTSLTTSQPSINQIYDVRGYNVVQDDQAIILNRKANPRKLKQADNKKQQVTEIVRSRSTGSSSSSFSFPKNSRKLSDERHSNKLIDKVHEKTSTIKKTRHVSPFPNTQSQSQSKSLSQAQSRLQTKSQSTLPPRPRSAPPRNQSQQRDLHQFQPYQTSVVKKNNTTTSKKNNIKKNTVQDISLSLNSDYSTRR